MIKDLKILGNGQIWDLRRILSTAPEKTFEDLFSGRALAQMAYKANQRSLKTKRIFSQFKEKGRITGLSVTQALLSNNQQAREVSITLLKRLAKNAAAGIEALDKGRGFKANWSNQERNCWKNLNAIIIGGGVSEGLTGRTLVRLIKRYLSQRGLSDIYVYQAKFPGKEAGFIGGVINILKLIYSEAKKRGLREIAAIGLDLGREEIGVGLLAINFKSGEIILKKRGHPWFFERSVKTPYFRRLKTFLDSRRDYTKKERLLGRRIRAAILNQMVNLIIRSQSKAREFGFSCSENIAVAVPGSTFSGYIINSTDYLPFFRKQDGFNFSQALKESLANRGIKGCHIHILNDGIAAGIANAYLGLPRMKTGKFAFLGVGSGLGGCVGLISRD